MPNLTCRWALCMPITPHRHYYIPSVYCTYTQYAVLTLFSVSSYYPDGTAAVFDDIGIRTWNFHLPPFFCITLMLCMPATLRF